MRDVKRRRSGAAATDDNAAQEIQTSEKENLKMAKQASIQLKNLTKEYVTHEGTGTFWRWTTSTWISPAASS